MPLEIVKEVRPYLCKRILELEYPVETHEIKHVKIIPYIPSLNFVNPTAPPRQPTKKLLQAIPLPARLQQNIPTNSKIFSHKN